MPRIIIADDQEQDRYLLQVLLQKSGFIVEAAADGAQALTLARKSPPDLMVSDILMPVMDGFCLCREWHKDKALCAIPFVFYTATYTDPRDEDFALKLGADKFIVKPVEPSALLDAIKKVLTQRLQRKPVIPDAGAEKEDGYFKNYSEVLVRKLEDKLEQFRAIFDIDPSAIFLLSPSGAIAELNRAGAGLLGGRMDEALDANFVNRYVPEQERSVFSEHINGALSGSILRNFESSIWMADGSERTLSWNARRVMRASGTIEGVLLIGSDITARRRAEKQRTELEIQLRQAQKMEAIGAFAGGIAHDFNNILTGILGFVDMTRHEVAPGSHAAENLQNALLAAQRAKHLVSQILSISRRADETFKPLEIAGIIEEAGKLLRASIPRSIAISLHIDHNCGSVMCDPSQIHQIIMNLCTNAYHAIGDSKGEIGISCRVLEEPVEISASEPFLVPGEYIVITVTDTGTGMNSATMARIFDPYFTTKEEGKGTGLGLPVVKAIVRSHGGQILVNSTEGKGSAFRVFLPKFKLSAPLPAKASYGTWETGGNELVLLVEDDEIIGPMFMRALIELGYRVALASDGAKALALFEKNPGAYNAAITDLTMPFMGGLELARRLNALRPGLPVILMSGSSELNEVQCKGVEGVKAFLKKPFSISELSRTLKSVCSQKK